MVRFSKLPRSRQLLAGVLAAGALTVVLWVAGLLGTAQRLTAYAVALLAIGVASLAVGAIGVYYEQRDFTRQQADQLSRAKVVDIALVEIERLSGPGELAMINVRNASSRAIRNVYVWIDVRGVPGHFAAGIAPQDPRSRHMIYVPRDDDLLWRLRAMRPGGDALFAQLTHLNPNPVPAVSDAEITAFAEFLDTEGSWWRCDEDGTVTRVQSGEPAQDGPRQGRRQPAKTGETAPQPHRRELTSGRELLQAARYAGRVARRSKSGYGDMP